MNMTSQQVVQVLRDIFNHPSLKMNAMEFSVFDNAIAIVDEKFHPKQEEIKNQPLPEVRELQGMQAAIQDEQHRKELRQEKRKQRIKGIRDGFLGAITTAGIILILL